jgi:hypothetical protein
VQPRFVRIAVVGVLALARAPAFAGIWENEQVGSEIMLQLTELLAAGLLIGGAVYLVILLMAIYQILRRGI